MSVSIIRDNAPALAALIEKAARGAVKASCEAVKEDCEANARIRTGSLRASFYAAVAGEESGYGESVADAQGRNPKVQIFEEVKPEAPNSGVVSAAAEHSLYQELGSIHNAPNPVMHQAADHERGRFPARVEKAIAEVTK